MDMIDTLQEPTYIGTVSAIDIDFRTGVIRSQSQSSREFHFSWGTESVDELTPIPPTIGEVVRFKIRRGDMVHGKPVAEVIETQP